ncbi:MAG: hypothetical protein Q9O62_09135 [Ardenticatenia bacterium]|nr:hypothetical protein [Ardenticatenia bacterium]
MDPEDGIAVLEFIVAHTSPEDVARKQDVSEAEARVRLEIEQVRADLTKEIEQIPRRPHQGG